MSPIARCPASSLTSSSARFLLPVPPRRTQTSSALRLSTVSQQGRSSRLGRIAAPFGESAPLMSPHHCGHWSGVQISGLDSLACMLLAPASSTVCRSLCHAHCLSVCHSETLLAFASARGTFLTLLSLTSPTLLSWVLLRYSITLRPRSDSYAHSV